MKKEKKTLNKIEIDKKRDRSILWCKIISIIGILISLFAFLFSCSANNTINKIDNVVKGVDTPSNRSLYRSIDNNSYTSNSYVYDGNIAYRVNLENHSNLSIGIDYLQENYFNMENQYNMYIHFQYNGDIPSNFTYLVRYIQIDTEVIFSIDNFNNDTFYIEFDDLDYYDMYIIFNFPCPVSNELNNIFSFSYYISNYLDNSIPTLQLYGYDLTGSFSLTSDFSTQDYYINGVIWLNEENYYTFNRLKLSFNGGLEFFSNTGYYNFYESILIGTNKVFYLNNVALADNNYLSILSIILTTDFYYNISNDIFMSNFLPINYYIDIRDLFASQVSYTYSSSFDKTFNFNFIANNESFASIRVVYSVNSIQDRWFYSIYFDDLLVLDLTAVVVYDGNFEYGGIKYNFNTELVRYMTIYIEEFSKGLQSFQAYTYVMYLPLDNWEDILDNGIFDRVLQMVVIGFTALLPLLEFEIFPSITISMFLLVPLLITLMLFIFSMFKR